MRVDRQGEPDGGGEGDRVIGSDSGNPFVMGGECWFDNTLTTSSGEFNLCKVCECADLSPTN